MKKCSTCKLELPESEFSPTAHQCKSCAAARTRSYYAKHRDECCGKAKRYREEMKLRPVIGTKTRVHSVTQQSQQPNLVFALRGVKHVL